MWTVCLYQAQGLNHSALPLLRLCLHARSPPAAQYPAGAKCGDVAGDGSLSEFQRCGPGRKFDITLGNTAINGTTDADAAPRCCMAAYTCMLCNAGLFADGSTCSPCPAGKVRVRAFSTGCTMLGGPLWPFGLCSGADVSALCIAVCLQVSQAGAAACTACGAGMVPNEQRTACVCQSADTMQQVGNVCGECGAGGMLAQHAQLLLAC